MENNLLEYFIKDSQVIKDMLMDIGFEIKDEDHYGGGYLIYSTKNGDVMDDIGLVIYPDLLRYDEYNKNKNFTENILSMWVGLKIWIPENENLEEKAKEFKELLRFMPIKPFFDEDAYLQIFTKDECQSNIKGYNLTCYFNPKYPDGMWENHTL